MNKKMLLEKLSKEKQVFLTEDQILKMVGQEIGYNKAVLREYLNALLDSGEIILTERRKYALSSKSGLIKGTFLASSKGFGFVEVSKDTDDIYISEKHTGGAVQGDIVFVKLLSKPNAYGKKGSKNNFKPRSAEGEVVKIIKRKLTQIVGTFMASSSGDYVVPDDTRFASQVFISKLDTMNAKTNQKVVAKILSYPSRNQMAIGKVIEVLGDINEVGVDTLSIIRSFALTEVFPEPVMAEAKVVAVEPTEKDFENREDFTNDLTITIDGEDARDFDDAISLVKTKEDEYKLNVHIADVAHYVKQNGEIDKEAFARGTSVYFPDMVLPMLPEDLSNNVCSLKPDVTRLTLSVKMVFDKYGNIKNYDIVNGYIKSKHRMTYTEVTKMFDGDSELLAKYSDVAPMLENMKELAIALIKRRDNAGQLDFNLPEVQIDMDENNKIKDIRRKPRNMSDRLIEQFMVVTNEVVARHMKNMGVPFVYRVHELPSQEKLSTFNEFIKGMGLNLKVPEAEVKARDIQKVLLAVKDRPMETIINSVLLRAMQKAKYYEMPLGHFALALADYCHFTSPIRRYPDLTIHRIIKATLGGKLKGRELEFYEDFVTDSAKQSSDRERLADEAERTVDDLKKAEYMTRFIGEEFDGIISGVTENGIFVELENTVEGMVRVEDLAQDRYYFDERKYALIGKNNTYRLGDKIKIKVFATDLITRNIDFILAGSETSNREVL